MKVTCPTCLEPTDFSSDLANTTQKCPTCNNSIQVPEDKSSTATKAASTAAVASTADRPKRSDEIESRRQSIKREVARKKKEASKEDPPRFSFRILGAAFFLFVFLVASLAYVGIASAFYFMDPVPELLLENKDLIGDKLGILTPDNYSMQDFAITMAKALVPALLAFMAMIAVCRRKRISAIILLTLLTLLGFLFGTPLLAILCLILVSVPGRSEAWNR